MFNSVFKKIKEFIPKSISPEQAKDTGMAMVLICLLIATLGRQRRFVGISIILLLIDMIWPRVYKPLAVFWFGFSRLLGAVMSRIMFSLIYIVMVVPVGLLRKLLGKDSLQLKKWKKGRTSVLKVRDHEFTPNDIAHPY